MSVDSLIYIISRLVFGAGAAFFAIILWARTRDSAWMFIVVGIIFRYGQIMYDTFEIFGIVNKDVMIVPNLILLDTILEVVPNIFFIVAFLIMIIRTYKKKF